MGSSDESNKEVEGVLMNDIIPEKSRTKYLNVYENFMKWKRLNMEETFAEKVFLTYFNELAKTSKPSSLWAAYSMLKSTTRVKHNIYIEEYKNLRMFLKKRSVGFKSHQSKILTEDNITKFLNEAPDAKYLATKVALILGVCGGLQITELNNFKTNSIKVVDDLMIGLLLDPNDKTEKIFAIREEYIPIVQKYQSLRPDNMATSRFFVKFRDGECMKQVIGRHKLATLPKEIATYLKLPDPARYTGHCFRRSAAAFGAVVKNVDKSNKRPKMVTQGELSEILDFAKRYKKDHYYRKGLVVEIGPMIDDSSQNEEAGPVSVIPVKIEEEEMETTDEFYIKTEPIDEIALNPLEIFEKDNMQGTSKPSVSDKQLSDFIIEDSDDSSIDMVRITSENVDRSTTLQSLREEASKETSSPHDTKITVAGKNITILFQNCTNVGNVTVNIINN